MDVKDIIRKTENAVQFRALMKEDGTELSEAEAEEVYAHYTKGEKLSVDE